MVGLGWHMVVNRTSGQRGANEQHYDGPTLDSDVGPTIRTPEDQRRPNVVLLSGISLFFLVLKGLYKTPKRFGAKQKLMTKNIVAHKKRHCFWTNLPHARNRPELREAIQLVSLFPESKNVISSLYIIPNDCDSPSPMKCRIKLPTNNTADDPIVFISIQGRKIKVSTKILRNKTVSLLTMLFKWKKKKYIAAFVNTYKSST